MIKILSKIGDTKVSFCILDQGESIIDLVQVRSSIDTDDAKKFSEERRIPKREIVTATRYL